MTIRDDELKNMAQLACMDIDSEYGDTLAEDVNAIMDFVEQLKQVDTSGVSPLFHPLDLQQRFRKDTVHENDCSVELAAIAPLFEDNLYLVPKVIDSGE
ncbi:Asp-tRNA(Asn)/Glu-tRNA(Gln) amidotransferase subunit GatC [Legionella jordanis]|uniref:Aspartyl/glutamyl-tRNA(Asn/Gln) amidotransferase subunit C n=1 Tax=Legionella jordanis TaxID=456 RepID=A0A0W0VA41_9GAMM|nr:Asp-tRNA(Asn)/Glu-tRNA(Gln) amidotransferase subunit GatC [Legionella jordanis]KTD16988.1 glutamyl/tRNA (Gln) amidotransferase subunit C [Legionella jordanis]RMX03128.1 Asp-tRNA(Asn)/Glu-tRNA(Gln) amidotransferase subunit GatC [Legionella jordanis]RMX18733.1 Asp-tRNA(Asn)/Glu-tRNA(Gln) amidotransferase subunit GatC [Legionella jordanis]VEH12818.1 glutamyl/tRNA (Gln) amidotransferase subunit C [Legionella jordanis]HAT8713039.1 Asp-tRNA(Asn)/Glu-tRNA(Gln) amidotransferase subunit GatC [Legion